MARDLPLGGGGRHLQARRGLTGGFFARRENPRTGSAGTASSGARVALPRRALAGPLLPPILLAALASCPGGPAEHEVRWSEHQRPAADVETTFEVPPPPFSEGIFPCSDCHDPDIPVNTKRRPMRAAHEEIVLDHDEEHRWCLDCHDTEDRDRLHLASGELVEFEESYRLCGQCHGDKYRDWRAGIHGRRRGSWDGHKTYLLCVNCHDSHSPRFKPIRPEPAPIAPRRTP